MARLRITRACYVHGSRIEPDTVLELADEVAADLLNCGKAEPADEPTRRRLHTVELASWQAAPPPDEPPPRNWLRGWRE